LVGKFLFLPFCSVFFILMARLVHEAGKNPEQRRGKWNICFRDPGVLNNDVHLSGKHLSDREMLLAADGELSPHRDAHVRAHLSGCVSCRKRIREIEGVIASFARFHRVGGVRLPSISGPRAQLQARLTEILSRTRQQLAGDPILALHLRVGNPVCPLVCRAQWAYSQKRHGINRISSENHDFPSARL